MIPQEFDYNIPTDVGQAVSPANPADGGHA